MHITGWHTLKPPINSFYNQSLREVLSLGFFFLMPSPNYRKLGTVQLRLVFRISDF